MRKLCVLFALGVLGAGLLATTGSAATKSASARTCGAKAPSNGTGRFGGVLSAQAVAASGSCAVHTTSDPANGGPPLIWWGGPVMGNAGNSPIVVTPIFWNPAGGGHPMNGAYKSILQQYLGNVAAASGDTSNVFSTMTEYYGSNGTGNINYDVQLGTPINDTHALPPSACTVASDDTTNIYADGTGYNACIDDDQLTSEIQRVITANGLPQNDYQHIYVMYTPKHVESCYYAGSTLTSSNGCTINHHPSTRYCAYHSMMGSNWPDFGTVYANMPYPIYASETGYTCGTDAGLGVLESPNHNLDADTETSPSSHEIMESITDPNVFNGWYDQYGYENGDECAYVWGPVAGKPGQEYNQTINGHHYITQEEFSNQDFADTGGGCVQSEDAVG